MSERLIVLRFGANTVYKVRVAGLSKTGGMNLLINEKAIEWNPFESREETHRKLAAFQADPPRKQGASVWPRLFLPAARAMHTAETQSELSENDRVLMRERDDGTTGLLAMFLNATNLTLKNLSERGAIRCEEKTWPVPLSVTGAMNQGIDESILKNEIKPEYVAGLRKLQECMKKNYPDGVRTKAPEAPLPPAAAPGKS